MLALWDSVVRALHVRPACLDWFVFSGVPLQATACRFPQSHHNRQFLIFTDSTRWRVKLMLRDVAQQPHAVTYRTERDQNRSHITKCLWSTLGWYQCNPYSFNTFKLLKIPEQLRPVCATSVLKQELADNFNTLSERHVS